MPNKTNSNKMFGLARGSTSAAECLTNSGYLSYLRTISDSLKTYQLMCTTPSSQKKIWKKWTKKLNLIPFGKVSAECLWTETLKTHYGWNIGFCLNAILFFLRVGRCWTCSLECINFSIPTKSEYQKRHVHRAWAWVWPCDVLK